MGVDVSFPEHELEERRDEGAGIGVARDDVGEGNDGGPLRVEVPPHQDALGVQGGLRGAETGGRSHADPVVGLGALAGRTLDPADDATQPGGPGERIHAR